MKLFVRFLRIYTPFICTLVALLNGVLFMMGDAQGDFIYFSSALTGNSVAVVIYMFCASLKMCVWYKMNLLCLLFIQIIGITYNYFNIEFSIYLLIVVLLASMGIISFLVFRIFYRIL